MYVIYIYTYIYIYIYMYSTKVWIENVPDPSGNCLFSQVNETICTLITAFQFTYGKNRPAKETSSTDAITQ